MARFSPLDAIPKCDSDALRVILNLSHPFDGESVNKSIDKEVYDEFDDTTLKYPSVDDLAKLIRQKGRSSKIFKRDLSKAYRQLFCCLSSIHLLGYTFENRMYFDVTLSMGSKSSAYCCQRMTNAITHVYKQHEFEDVNYLDDLGTAEIDSKVEEAYDCLGWILDTIGIRESKTKACLLACIAIFLGILFNTLTMTMQITDDRMTKIKSLLVKWLDVETASLKEVQSLLGKLNFAASTVRAGRVFVSRIINELKTLPINGKVKISEELKMDIKWWYTFMHEFDGISIMPPEKWDAPDTVIQTDSCLTHCRGWSHGEAFTAKFPNWIRQRSDIHINELELLAFVVAVKIWSEQIQNRNLLAYSNNEVSVEIVSSGKAQNKFAQACLRELCYITAKNNAVVKLICLLGTQNRISDCLSRWSDKKKQEEFQKLTKNWKVNFVKVDDDNFQFSHTW